MRHAKRVDGNHKEIRDGLREAGYRVRDHSACGDGIPDLCVMVAPGYSLHLEIKDPEQAKLDKRKGELTKAETEWWAFNCSITRKVFTLEEALRVLAEYREELGCTTSRRVG